MDSNNVEVPKARAVTLSLKELIDDTVSFETLTEAFGPESLGIILVKDLEPRFTYLRSRVLCNASYLAALPDDELESLSNPQSKYLTGWSRGKETLRSGHYDTLKGSYYVNCAFYQNQSLQGAPSASASATATATATTIGGGSPGSDFEASEPNHHDYPEYTTPNIWPDEARCRLHGFRSSLEELCTLIIDTAALVARACDRFALANVEGYPGGYLEGVVRGSFTSKARLLHYFPLGLGGGSLGGDDGGGDGDDDDWCATHLDHGCLTGLTSAMFVDEVATSPEQLLKDTSATSPPILPELQQSPDPAAGLYIRSRTNKVVKVDIPRDCLAFQTGEALQLITRGRFRAVPHFVRGVRSKGLGGGAGGGVARNTLAVFTQPNLGEVIGDHGLRFADFARGVVERTY